MIAQPSGDGRLSALEGVISRGLQSFIEVGNALEEIRAEGLYKPEHPTFEVYCRERLNLSRCYAYDLIGAAKVADNLSVITDKVPDRAEQVRPLRVLPAAQQQEAWAEAVKTAPEGKVTGRHVASVVRELFPRPTRPEPEGVPDEGATQEGEEDDYIGTEANALISVLLRLDSLIGKVSAEDLAAHRATGLTKAARLQEKKMAERAAAYLTAYAAQGG